MLLLSRNEYGGKDTNGAAAVSAEAPKVNAKATRATVVLLAVRLPLKAALPVTLLATLVGQVGRRPR